MSFVYSDRFEGVAFRSGAELARFEADARALWAVRVLDAWAERRASRADAGYPEHWSCFPWGDLQTACGERRVRDCVCGDCESLRIQTFRVTLSGDGGQIFDGPTPDAARIAAADALVAEDPSLGEGL
jgi:hypothetical protein